MIRFARQSWAVVAVAGLVAVGGCADQPPVAKPVKPVAEVVEPIERAASEMAAAPKPAAAELTPAGDRPATAPAPPAPTIAALLQTLAAAAGSDERVLAIDEIGAVGQNARPALDALIAAFADAEPRVRWHAARAVGLIGEDALSALPKLVTLLGDADPLVVTQAAAAIARIRGDDGRPQIPDADAAIYAAAVDPLAGTAVHPDPRARRAAVRALRVLSPSLAAMAPVVSKHLADADPTVVIGALHTLADMGVESLPFLTKALAEPGSRYWATVVLAEMGPAAAPALPQLTALAGDAELDERLQAIYALAGIGEAAADSAPVLVAALEGNEPVLRYAAAHALGRIRAAAADEALARAASDDNPLLAEVASWARARIDPADESLMDAALARLESGLAAADPSIRAASVAGLADLAQFLEPPRRQSIAGLFARSLGDPDDGVSLKAGGALVQLGPAAVDAIRSLLGDAALRPRALEVLAAMGGGAAAALPEIEAALDDPDAKVRGEAAFALGSLGPDAAALVPKLAGLLAEDEAPEVRYTAAYALGRVGAAAAPAFDQLVTLTTSADDLLATVAVWAALKIRPDDRELFAQAVPLLERALDSEREMVRLEAAVSLGEIGAAAAAAVPALELVAENDPVERVRDAAAHSIAEIRSR